MKAFLSLVILMAVIYCIVQCFTAISIDDTSPSILTDGSENGPPGHENKLIAKRLMKDASFINLKNSRFDLKKDGKEYRVKTSVDVSLQNYMLEKLDRKNSRHIGLLALDPANGKVLMMAGFDKMNPDNNTCLANQYPAASIFKIVTAAAATELERLDSNSRLRFNGNRHTLYKSQLKERSNKYTNHTTFQDSFAKSINPVFGKIGALKLKKKYLLKYAEAFGFNEHIDFELPLAPSHISISENPYHWAEIACGFNRETTISPLHAALLPSIIVNEGKLIEPSIIDRISNENGEILYENKPHFTRQVISPATSRVVYALMEATVRYGTSKKAFKGYQKDVILSKLNLGGKTGSIFNKKHDLRYDWFVGFADLKNGSKKLTVAVVVAHEEYIGIRASKYARMVFEKYYTDYFKTS